MKKFISIILVFAFVVSCFCGCQKATNDNKQEAQKINLDLKYTFDSIYSDFDESAVRAYNDLCDAVVNYQPTVRFNVAMLDDVLQLFYTSFPMSVLTKAVDVSEDQSGVTISYLFDETEHKSKEQEFNDKIKKIEEECGFSGSNKGVYTLNVYHYVSSNMNISKDSSISLFDTVLTGEGSIFSYANLFEYLLLQKDIMAFHVLAEDAGGTGWGLSSAELNNKIYYFDMATEYYSNQGNGINFFAMSYKDLKTVGLKNAKYSSGGEAYKETDKKFFACRSAKTWSLEGDTLKIVKYDLKEKSIKLK